MALAYTAHGAQAGSATAATTSGAVTVTAAAGDTILVAVATASGGSAPTATDSAGGVYRIVSGPSTNTDNVWLLVRTIPCSGSVTTVTVSWTGSARWSVAIDTWSGVRGFANVKNTATGSSTAPSIAVVQLGAVDWIVAGMFNTGTGTWSATTGNLRAHIAGAGSTTPGAALMDNTTVTCTALLSASSLWGACAVALLGADVPVGTGRMALAAALAAFAAAPSATAMQFRKYMLIDEPIPPVAFRRDPVPWVPLDWGVQKAAPVAALIQVVAAVPVVPFRRDPVPWVPGDWTAQRAGPVAPLTLPTGQQPPRIGGSPLSIPNASAIGQPAPTWAAQSGPTIAPLTLPTGQKPPGVAPAPRPGVLDSWAVTWGAQRAGPVAPLTLVYGQQPPPIPWAILTGPTIRAAWVVDWAAQRGPQIVALTLPTGQQPPPWSWVTGPTILGAWTVTWAAQSSAPVAAWSGSVLVPPFLPYRRDPVGWIELSWPAQSENDVAPITFVYGQQPPARAPGPVPPWPALDWPAQAAAPTAAWNVPVVVAASQPYRRDPIQWLPPDWSAQVAAPSAAWNLGGSVLAGGAPGGLAMALAIPWPVLDWPAQRSAVVAPLTLVYGQQPPLQLLTLPAALAWPPLDWPAQSENDNACWNQPPPSVHYVPPPFPGAILPAWVVDWRAQSAAPVAAFAGSIAVPVFPYRRDPVPWIPLDWGAQRAAPVAPLTLVYGQQPPRVRPADLTYVLPWVVDWPAQSENDNAAWSTFIAAYLPFRRDAAFQPTPTWDAQRGARIAPLTLVYGQQPPRRAPISVPVMTVLLTPGLLWDAQRSPIIAAILFVPSGLVGPITALDAVEGFVVIAVADGFSVTDEISPRFTVSP